MVIVTYYKSFEKVNHFVKRKDNIMVWRVFSCLSVFITHLARVLDLKGSLKVVTDFGGYIAVYFFIAIAGYLAFAGYKDGMKAVDYWKKRALKILPLYYLVILYCYVVHTFILGNVPPDETGLGWLRYIFFLSDIVPAGNAFWRNIYMTWTICWIVLFYLAIPLIHRIVDSFNKALVFCAFSYIVYFFKGMLIGEWFNAIKGFFFLSVGIAVYFAIKEKKEKILITLFAWGTFFFLIQSANKELTGIMLFGILLLATDGLELKDNIIKKAISVVDRYTYEIYLIQGVVFTDIVWSRFTDNVIPAWIKIILVAVLCTAFFAILVHELLRILIYDRVKKDSGPKIQEPAN